MAVKQFQMFNPRLIFSCCLIAISSANYGFDNQSFSTTAAMDGFDKEFGQYSHAAKTYTLPAAWLSLYNSLNYIGFAAGVLIGGWVSAKVGRRWCMFAMSCYALCSATVIITSSTKEQILTGRVLNYVYVGMELAVVPAFQSEIVPAPARGLVVGSYQFSLIFGGLIINIVCRFTSVIQDARSWRIPFGLFYIVPTIVLSLIWFVPESPRWLLMQGHTEQARKNLWKYRAGRFSETQVEEEFRTLQLTLEEEQETGRWSELVQGVNLRRTLIVVMVNFFQQATGQAFASQLGAIYIKSLGTVNPFDMILVIAACNILALTISLYLTDRIGRRQVFVNPTVGTRPDDLYRPLLILSAALLTVSLMVMGGLGCANPVTVPYKTGIVAMIVMMAFGFSIGYGPLTYVVTTELPALRLRDKTIRVGFFVNVLFNFVVNFSVPYLVEEGYANLQSKVGFIFGGISFLCVACTYLFMPECKGKTLEEVDLMFHHGVKLSKFGSYDPRDLVTETKQHAGHEESTQFPRAAQTLS